MSIELVRAYTAFKTKNIKIKARQSRERVAELEPLLAEVGRQIINMQAAGATITDIGNAIGLKNRNFIYDAKRAYQGVPDAEHTEHDPDVTEPDESPTPDIEDSWQHVDDSSYVVTVDGDEYEVYYENDELVIPDEWLDAPSPAYKKVYQRIIAEIEAAHEAA